MTGWGWPLYFRSVIIAKAEIHEFSNSSNLCDHLFFEPHRLEGDATISASNAMSHEGL